METENNYNQNQINNEIQRLETEWPALKDAVKAYNREGRANDYQGTMSRIAEQTLNIKEGDDLAKWGSEKKFIDGIINKYQVLLEQGVFPKMAKTKNPQEMEQLPETQRTLSPQLRTEEEARIEKEGDAAKAPTTFQKVTNFFLGKKDRSA